MSQQRIGPIRHPYIVLIPYVPLAILRNQRRIYSLCRLLCMEYLLTLHCPTLLQVASLPKYHPRHQVRTFQICLPCSHRSHQASTLQIYLQCNPHQDQMCLLATLKTKRLFVKKISCACGGKINAVLNLVLNSSPKSYARVVGRDANGKGEDVEKDKSL